MGRLPALRDLAVRLPAALMIVIGGLAANCLVVGTAHAVTPDDYFGVNAQPLFTEPASSWPPQLAAMAVGGLQLVRTDARWADVEPSPPNRGVHTYRWSEYDAIVQALAQQGLRWYPALEVAPAWAAAGAGDPSPASSHAADFAAFAGTLAARYGSRGSFWRSHPSLAALPVEDYEIWNEENSTVFWLSQADAPERYADLYLLARQAVRAADPPARVVVGGLALGDAPLAQDEVGFLARMVAHRPDLRGLVDGVGLHPYQATLPDLYARLDHVRAAVDFALGSSVPIDVTEAGWTTALVSEQQRAENVAALATDLPRSDCGVDRLLVYSWLSADSNLLDPEAWFGIWNQNGSAKQSGQAYTQAVLSMRGLSARPPPGGTLDLCPSSAAAESAGRGATVRGPTLRLRTLVNRHRRQLTVLARCPTGCTLKLALMRRHASRLTPVAHRSTRFSKRRWRIGLRYPRRARHLQLNVVATGAGGGRTTRVRRIRVR
ncbi:MAG TPA: hypothetical protein VGF74_12025 [Thermoleophilaceae bacterium]